MKPLGQILKQMGLVTEYDIQQALAIQKEKGGAMREAGVRAGLN